MYYNENIKLKGENIMNKLGKINFIGQIFMEGAKAQLHQEWTIGAAATIGLMQGLKYKGSFKQGTIGALATLGVLAGANGVYAVINNWDVIKSI
jgi:hypothetical protein